MKLIEYPHRNGSKFKLEFETAQEQYKFKKINRAVQKHIIEWEENLSLDASVPYEVLIMELVTSIEHKFSVKLNYEECPFYGGIKPKIQIKTTPMPNGEVEVVCFTTIELKRYVNTSEVDAMKKKLANHMIEAIGYMGGIAKEASRGLDE